MSDYLEPAECILEQSQDGFVRIKHCPELFTASREAIQRIIDNQNKHLTERNQAIAERDDLLDALQTIEFFVMDDYYPNCATPPYKAAVEKMIDTLKKFK